MEEKIVIIGILIAITIAMIITIPAAKAYTLDAKLTNANTSPMFEMGQTFYKATDIKITDLPSSLQAVSGTLVDSNGEVKFQIYPTRIAYSGSMSYKTPDGGTNIASTYISSDFKKILTDSNGITTYTLRDKFQGTEGTLTLNGPIKDVMTTGTLHIEGIKDPTND
jgi:hypothetical protein